MSLHYMEIICRLSQSMALSLNYDHGIVWNKVISMWWAHTTGMLAAGWATGWLCHLLWAWCCFPPFALSLCYILSVQDMSKFMLKHEAFLHGSYVIYNTIKKLLIPYPSHLSGLCCSWILSWLCPLEGWFYVSGHRKTQNTRVQKIHILDFVIMHFQASPVLNICERYPKCMHRMPPDKEYTV